MKKTLTIIALALLVFSCSNDNSSSNNDNNNTSGNVDYEFTININGVVHKVKGNTSQGLPNGQVLAPDTFNWINNTCTSTNLQPYGTIVTLGINDVTTSNYISGQNLNCQINFGNLLLGKNKAQVLFRGQYFTDLSSSLGSSSYGFYFQTVSGKNNSEYTELTFNITDLGTNSSSSYPYSFGNTLKGNYSGTIYIPRKDFTTYDIPVQLSIDFKAVRLY